MKENKCCIKLYVITGVITFSAMFIYVLNLTYQSISIEPIKVYKDLTLEDEITLYENIDAIKKSQIELIDRDDNNQVDQYVISKAVKNIDITEPKKEPVEDRTSEINSMSLGERIMNGLEDIPKPTKIVDFGNGNVFDPSKSVLITPKMLGISPIVYTDREDINRMASEIESYNIPEIQSIVNMLRQGGNPHESRK